MELIKYHILFTLDCEHDFILSLAAEFMNKYKNLGLEFYKSIAAFNL
jgi:hypothetical protein